PITQFDLSRLSKLDTAGASLLVELLGADMAATLERQTSSLSPERLALLERVHLSMAHEPAPAQPTESSAITQLLARIGSATERFYKNFITLMGFIGLIMETLVFNLPRPSRWRLTAIV